MTAVLPRRGDRDTHMQRGGRVKIERRIGPVTSQGKMLQKQQTHQHIDFGLLASESVGA